ncbi:LLM class flavin-dependent oxidoreductase [Bordetella tumulicola]|uniref:LLM class flavin-dependent oxidoreductase n=1 Tax=Bordetella tumulicola TaxID=1649133 RepID=UPI0039EFD55C
MPSHAPASRELHLNINMLHSGFVPSAWRLPEAQTDALFDVAHYVRLAQVAERGAFDAVFLADTAAISDQVQYRSINALEPTLLLATLAAHTRRIGLIATVSTSYNEPYNIARRFATLDHISAGRAGWNIVTTADPASARNFGRDVAIDHQERYARAAEFADVVKALWHSWQPGAFLGDKNSGYFADPDRIQPIAHQGKFFSVHGPLTLPPSRQGHPVLVQAGGSGDGRELAARHAEAVFSASESIDESRAYRRDLHERAAKYGRGPNAVSVLAGLTTIIGATEEAAYRRRDELMDLIPLEYSVKRLAGTLGVPLESIKLDEPIAQNLALPKNGTHTFFNTTLAAAKRTGATARELIREFAGGGGHRVIVGTPEQIADDIEHWFRTEAADGFNLMPDTLPGGLEDFVDGVVPILRQRGIFRNEYRGDTLRSHLGLGAP